MEKKTLFEKQLRRPKAIVIAGPTAVGKSALSLQLAQQLNAEIVSADAMQVYCGMDIGTAKVEPAQRELIAHHCIDIKKISEACNVVDFFIEAKTAIFSILTRGKVPLIVGGTGFYIEALIKGPPSGPPSEPTVRKWLEKQVQSQGIQSLYQRVCTLDPLYAKKIAPSDQRRIIRALEIMAIAKKKVSDFDGEVAHGLNLNFRCWFLTRKRANLYQRIEARCEKMVQAGLVEEVQYLVERGLVENKTACQAIGYKQVLKQIQEKKSLEDQELIQTIKQHSRRYAKSQYTWFRKKKHFRWLDLDQLNLSEAVQLILDDFYLS